MESKLVAYFSNILNPGIYENLDKVLPSYDFKRHGNKWTSYCYLSGEKSKTQDKTFCTINLKFPPRIKENGGEDASVIDLFSGGSFKEKIDAIADICGVSRFPWGDNKMDSEFLQEKEEMKRASKILSESLEARRTPQAKEAYEYLKSRFNRGELVDFAIKKGYLGFLDDEAFSQIKRDCPSLSKRISPKAVNMASISVKNKYSEFPETISFRATSDSAEPRHLNLSGDRPEIGGLYKGAKDVVIVEGTFDWLSPTLEMEYNKEDSGLCVAFIGSNQKSEENIKAIIKKASEDASFTIVPDIDKREEKEDGSLGTYWETPGFKGAKHNVELFRECSAKHIYVSDFSKGGESSEKIDTADYIKKNGFDKWRENLKAYRETSSLFLLRSMGEGSFSDVKERLESEDRIVKILSYKSEDGDIENCLEYLEDLGMGYDIDSIKRRALAMEGKANEEKTLKKMESLKGIAELYKMGYIDKVKSILGEITNSLESEGEDLTQYYKAPENTDEILQSLKSVHPGIETGLSVYNGDKKRIPITLKEGVSLVVGARKHGKTTILINMALREAYKNYKEGNKKKVLFVSYEVERRRILLDMISIYLRLYLKREGGKYITHDNKQMEIGANEGAYKKKVIPELITKKSVQAVFGKETELKELGKKYMERTDEELTQARFFIEREGKNFIKSIYQGQYMTIIDLGAKSDVETLKAELDTIYQDEDYKDNISLLCLDYIQELSSQNKTEGRTGELKHIGHVLRAIGKERKLPMLCCAQFNRLLGNILDVDTNNIGESGDLERNAVDAIGIYNLKELRPLTGGEQKEQLMREHKNILCKKLGLKNWEIIEDRETGKTYGKDGWDIMGNGYKKGDPQKDFNLKSCKGKIYIKLMVSRFSDAPGDVVTDFDGDSGFIDIEHTTEDIKEGWESRERTQEAEEQEKQAKRKKETEKWEAED